MASRRTTKNTPPPPPPRSTPVEPPVPHLETPMMTPRQEFARRLQHALIERGWSQAELARRVWNEHRTDKKGYEHPVGKDRISTYVRGLVMPDHANLTKLAAALEIPVAELAPHAMSSHVEQASPELEIKAISGTDTVLLQLRSVVSLDLAITIAGLISNHRDRKREAVQAALKHR
jgi:transcriptional regulator with XRE-family HTH domain